MKILYVVTSLDRGGAENSLKAIASCLNASNEIYIFCLTKEGVVSNEMKAMGLDIFCLNMLNVFSLLSTIKILKNKIKEINPDIVHTWLYHADLIGGIASRLAGINNVVWCVRTTKLKQGAYSTVLVRTVLSVFSYFIPKKIVCVAESSLKFHRKLGYAGNKLLVIGNGFLVPSLVVEPKNNMNFLAELNINPYDIIIGSVGRFSSDKGQDLFVKAAGLLLKKNGNLKFMIVGRGNHSGNQELVELIESTGFPSNFILLGEQSNVGELYSVMDVFCLHSRTEGFPNVLGEAMMYQKPCVVTRAGDAEHILGGTGVVVDGFEPEDIANALSTMLDYSDDQRIALGCEARARIINEFSFDSVVVKYTNLYKSLVSDY